MQQAAGHSQEGQAGIAGRLADDRDADPGGDDTDVFDAAVGQQSLDIPLGGRQADPHEGRDDPGHRQQSAPPERPYVHEGEETENTVNPHFQHNAREHGRNVAGGIGVGRRKPDVQRHQAGFGAEADQGRDEEQRCRDGGNLQAALTWKQKGAGMETEQGKQQVECRYADMARNQIDDPGPANILITVFGHQEEIARQGHDLPGDQQQYSIGGDDHHCHGGRQQAVEKGDRRLGSAMGGCRPVAIGIDRSAQENQEDRDQKKDRQRVENQLAGIEGKIPVDDICGALPVQQHQDGGWNRQERGRDGGAGRQALAGRSVFDQEAGNTGKSGHEDCGQQQGGVTKYVRKHFRPFRNNNLAGL